MQKRDYLRNHLIVCAHMAIKLSLEYKIKHLIVIWALSITKIIPINVRIVKIDLHYVGA